MRKLLLILIIILPSILVAQDTCHWLPELCKRIPKDIIPEKKIALVIGNTNYEKDEWDLKNPTNDVNLISKTFRKLEFEVILKENLTYKQIADVLKDFEDKQYEYDFSIIYYAGHALQDENYNSHIIPVDITDNNSYDSTINISELVSNLEYSEISCLLILDACRNTGSNDFIKPPRIQDPINVKLAYSTSFSTRASDDEDLENSIYTNWLSKVLLMEGMRIKDILDYLTIIVLKATKKQQNPAHYFGTTIGNIKFSKFKKSNIDLAEDAEIKDIKPPIDAPYGWSDIWPFLLGILLIILIYKIMKILIK